MKYLSVNIKTSKRVIFDVDNCPMNYGDIFVYKNDPYKVLGEVS